MRDNTVLISGAIVTKKVRGKDRWLLVKSEEDGDWEIPKANVRKVESSVRTAIRIILELAGMNASVVAEAGRAGGSTVVNDKTVPLRYIYYLMIWRNDEGGEALGYHDMQWMEYAPAVRKLTTKRDRAMIKAAREDLVALRKSDDGKKYLKE